MDSEGKIQNKLDDQIKATAAAQKKNFRETMMKLLEARRKEWEEEIR